MPLPNKANQKRKGENKMARKINITRSFKATKVNVLCLELETAEPFNTDLTLPRTYKDEKKLMNAVKEIIDTDKQKAVHITLAEEVNTMYGMTEEDFIKYGVELDPETRKAIEIESHEASEEI